MFLNACHLQVTVHFCIVIVTRYDTEISMSEFMSDIDLGVEFRRRRLECFLTEKGVSLHSLSF